MNLTCFKAYDIRGRLGDELNEDIARRIGRAYGEFLKPRRVAVGGDVRLTSEPLKRALAEGLMDAGVDVIDIGLAGTEEVYFAAFHLDVDGGIEVTASHNPLDYNGMKLVRRGAQPVSGDTGLKDIERLAAENAFPPSARRGVLTQQLILQPYVEHLLGYIQPAKLRPLKLVVNAGNGAAGHVIDVIEVRFKELRVPVEFIKVHHEPDGNFPNGIPNPLLPENRAATADAVIAHGADMGIAWDGDFDRCFLFDESGKFIEGYYIVGLLAAAFLAHKPGEKIIHDPRLTWNTIDIVEKAGGIPVQSKTGHAFIKERMRARKRHLWRRNERASLLPRLRLLRQRHDPLAAGCRADERHRQATVQPGERARGGLPVQWRDQLPGGRCQGRDEPGRSAFREPESDR